MSGEAPLLTGEVLLRVTTRQLARSLEGTALLFQVINIAASTFVENPDATGKEVMYGLAAIHLAALVLVLRVPGPIARGGPWAVLWVGLTLLMPLIAANAFRPGDYARYGAGVQLSGYSLATLAVLAFYPWRIAARRTWLRIPIECALLLLIAIEPLLIVLRMRQGVVSEESLRSVGMSAVWSVATYIGGKGLYRLFREATRMQLAVQEKSHKEFFGFLHSRVDGCLAALRRCTDVSQVERQMVLLKGVIDERRVDMLLVSDPMPLPEIVKEVVKLYSPSIVFAETPEIGPFSVCRTVGILVYQALGDLVKNATQYGADQVRITFAYTSADLTFQVIDNGPGFDDVVFEDTATSLRRLRDDVQGLGGELIRRDAAGGGAHLTFRLPLRPAGAQPW
jgi:signal transduction histidine kinase